MEAHESGVFVQVPQTLMGPHYKGDLSVYCQVSGTRIL